MTAPGEFTHHFSSQFNRELANLRSRVLVMGRAVEQQLEAAVHAFETRSEAEAHAVIGADLHVNALEVYLDEECSRILARRQPAAGDLRLIFSVIKTVTDIERMGDQAKGVARMAIKLAAVEPEPHGVSIERLWGQVRTMVHKALGAISGMDVELALEVERADLEADAEYQVVMQRLTELMSTDPRVVDWALHFVWAARALERTGDHAKNICEYLIYLVQGQDVRHVSLEDRERQVQERAGGEVDSPGG